MRTAGLLAALAVASVAALGGEEPVALRAESFTVPPATGPVTHVIVQNLRPAAYAGKVGLRMPEGWELDRVEQAVTLGPNETRRVAFAIRKAANSDANTYPVEVVATGDDGSRAARRQSLFCASAPYGQPTIDGRAREWADAIPVTFTSGGKRTVVSTYWNRSDFCLLAEVEEEKLIGCREGAAFDAVQVAIAPRDAPAAATASAKAGRYEFLLAASGPSRPKDTCFLLATPDTLLSATQAARGLVSLAVKEAKLVVRRKAGVTTYECSLPFAAMPAVVPAEGREFFFSMLVHDPDGTGLRDLGEAAGLWPSQRNRLAWSLWPGAKWGADAPFDSHVEWGFCSSKH